MAHETKPRLLIIGIDGADWQITRHLMEDGYLPNLRALAKSGAFGPCRSTIPPTTPPAWTTIMTGKNPGKHGVFDFLPMSGEAMDTPIASRRRATTIWRALSDAGLRVGTFNLPATWPPERLSAFQVAGFDAAAFGPTLAWPREAFEVLRDAVGEYDIFPFSIQKPEGDPAAVRRHADIAVSGTRALLKRWPCDVYMVSFQVVDWVQHGHLGREMTPMAPTTLNEDGQVIKAYRIVDDRIGELVEEWKGDDTTVIVISDHGGTPADRLVNLEKLFLEHGLLAYTTTDGSTARLQERRSRAALALRLWLSLKRTLPPLARLLGPLARGMRERMSSYQKDVSIDWSRTRAAPWGDYGQIRLNIAGRDPHGVVPPGDIDSLIAEIKELLLSLRDPVSGEPIYQAVMSNEELYTGAWAHLGPDLHAVPVQERYMAASGRSGVAELPLLDVQPEPVVVLDPAWGIHSSSGIILMSGRGVWGQVSIIDATIADFTPTALHLLDYPVPADVDGRSLTEALDSDVVRAEPSVGEPWPAPEPADRQAYSDAEREAVEKRLRSLGYM